MNYESTVCFWKQKYENIMGNIIRKFYSPEDAGFLMVFSRGQI